MVVAASVVWAIKTDCVFGLYMVSWRNRPMISVENPSCLGLRIMSRKLRCWIKRFWEGFRMKGIVLRSLSTIRTSDSRKYCGSYKALSRGLSCMRRTRSAVSTSVTVCIVWFYFHFSWLKLPSKSCA